VSSAQLLWITPDAEKTMEYAARVSAPKNQERMENGELEAGNLLRYCARKGHWSVFEMANACLSITTTRDISAQILRHRSFSFQEFSTRYAKVVDAIAVPELRLQAEDNRQASIRSVTAHAAFENDVADLFGSVRELYDRMINEGIARETARRILPMCAPTKLYMNGTIRSWIHYLVVRCAPETQPEHRAVALQARALLARNLPIVAQAFGWKDEA